MSVAGALHGTLVHSRRVRVLAGHLARLVPRDAHVLDVGTGDGRIAAALVEQRPDLRVVGIDVLARSGTSIPVTAFDGRTIPMAAGSVDVVTFVDVLHHADDPIGLLAEAARVARSYVVLKDHVSNGPLSRWLLRLMDWVGNAPHGVRLPYHYLGTAQWREGFARAGLHLESWHVGALGLYPPPASLVFGGKLHVLAVARVR